MTFILERSKVRRRLWLCHIPLDIHEGFLKELEELGLVTQLNKQNLMINKKNIEKFYFKKE
jgi:hypothetical protein